MGVCEVSLSHAAMDVSDCPQLFADVADSRDGFLDTLRKGG